MDGEQSLKRSVCSIVQMERKMSLSLMDETLVSLELVFCAVLENLKMCIRSTFTRLRESSFKSF